MPNDTRTAWRTTLSQLALVLALAAGLGFAIGQIWPSLVVAAAAVLVWHYWKLRQVLSRLTARQRSAPPKGVGIWNELDRLLYRSQDETRGRNRRLVDMLRAYRAIATALPDGVVLVDRNSQRIQWFNESAGSLLGLHYPRDNGALLGERLQPLPIAHWLSGDRYTEPLLDVASPMRADIRLSLRLIPYSDDLWLLVARDVSKLMRLEHMRRDFVANVSHELRTPLTVVHGYLDMLDPAEQPEWAPMLTEMQRQSHRMTQLVEDLLMLSRLEVQEALPDEHVAMAPMLSTLKREAEALSKQRHKITIEDAVDIDLWGSTKELHSAFSNLVSNATRYTPAGGSITIRFAADADGVVLSVEDTGYGIPASHLPRITERFYRVSTSRSRESGGTGLGLSIVKHVLNLHQARLEIDSEVGSGSRFACHFGRERMRNREHCEDRDAGFAAATDTDSADDGITARSRGYRE
jgi:two-component system, OmpR family, phosphate regulon sensor histidine kinase PhoR